MAAMHSDTPLVRAAYLRMNLRRIFDSWAVQARVARDAHIHPVYLNRLLSGNTKNPTIRTIERLAVALEIAVETLLSPSPSDTDLRIPEKSVAGS